jgi:antirestriction protein ArdC
VVAALRSASVPFRPQASELVKARRGKAGFTRNQTKSKTPCPFREAGQKRSGENEPLRKGEHGEIVIFWKVEGMDEADHDPTNIEGNETARRRLLLKFYRVWNLEQCALPQAVLDKLPTIETHQHDPIEAAEKIIAGMPNRPAIRYEGSKAYYNSVTDQITLPPRELFTSAEEFYATLGHECLHASGHQSRLNRESITEAAPFGSPVYCREELIAEMGAAFLCAEVGISPVVLENQAAYVQGWLGKIRGDKRLVIIAAAQAQKAADYILNAAPERSEV